MTTISDSPYDGKYFDWQRHVDEFNAKASMSKYREYIHPTDNVVDFGCGGGHILAHLKCNGKAGIEVNPVARQHANSLGITCVETSDLIEDDWADVIISNSALEHTFNPMTELKKLYPKLRNGGLLLFSVPYESLSWKYVAGDINQHLYTWSPMSLGNLFAAAGFHVEKIDVIRHMLPPYGQFVFNIFGERLFGLVCRFYRILRLSLAFIRPVGCNAEMRLVARKLI